MIKDKDKLNIKRTNDYNIKPTQTKTLDDYLLQPATGFPIMLVCFTALFAASFVLGKPVSNLLGLGLDQLVIVFEHWAGANHFPDLFTSLVANGIFRGIGSALAFFPRAYFLCFLFGHQ
jgi:Fe2+ transport system protein B